MKKKISLLFLFVLIMPFAFLFTGCNKNTKYNINFIVDEQVYTKIETKGNEYIQLPNEPEKDGYIFIGWFFDDGIWQNEFKSNTYAKRTLDSNVNVFAYFTYIEDQIPINSITLNKTSLNLQTNGTYSLIATISPSNATYKKVSWSSSNLSVATVTNGKVKAVGIGQTIITAKANNNLTATCVVNVVDASQNVQVEVYIDGELNDTLTTNFQNGYKINIPTKPEDITTNPNSEKYFYGWFIDNNYQTPLTEDTTFMRNSKIYGKWINIYSNNFTYTVSKGKATITLFNNIQNSTVVVVPCYINSFPVETIGASTFINQTMLRNVIVCDGIKNIEAAAFYGCNSMTNIELPNTLENIETSAFENCELLTKIDFPNSLQTIGVNAFKNCSDLKHVNFNNNGWWVANDSNYVFEKNIETLNSGSNAQNLTVNQVNKIWSNYKLFSITYHLDNGHLPDNAPYYFSEYTTVNLVDAIKNGYTFKGFYTNSSCTSQKIEDIDKQNIDLEVWAKWSLNTYQIEYNLEGGSLLGSNPTTYNVEMSDFQLLSPTKEYYDFNGWYYGNNLINVVKTQLCKNMTLTAKFTPTIYTIEYELNGGVNDGANPATYTVESPTITLQSARFTNETICRWYSEDNFKTRITTIPQGSHGNIKLYARAGYDGYDICYISNTNTVTGINTSFIKEFNIELKSIVVPNDVVGISQGAFKDCSILEEITIPFIVSHLSYIFDDDSVSYSIPTSLKKVVLTGGTSISNYAFQNCHNLTSITIPESVTSIGSCAFEDCYGLNEVHISSLESWFNIDFSDGSSSSNPLYYAQHLYLNGTELTEITIPKTINEIKKYALCRASYITSITIPDSVTSIGSNAFYGCDRLNEVHISSLESWFNIDFSGDYSDPLYYAQHLYLNGTELTEITIPKTINEIKKYALCRASYITSITIPDSVTSIGDAAFEYCSSLTSITIPDSVTNIGNSAFRNCSGLTSITIPDTVTIIEGYAFFDCSSLTSITIPDSVTNIGNFAFSGCSSLTSITIPDSVTNIGNSAFFGCSSLTIYSEATSQPTNWESDWNFSYCRVYWYRETEPTTSGNYWHYVDGKVTKW